MTRKQFGDIGRLLPPHAPGMRIGLFGGTFDPPHEAHLGATLLALKRLKLDRVWWLVTPGNPLKDTSGLAPLRQRLAAARTLTHHPRIDVTGLEAVINTRYTYDTILWLLSRCPGVRFVWIMGADNLRSFHRWQRWREIAKLLPIVVVDRLGPSLYASAGPAGQALARARISDTAAASLPDRHPPAWLYLHGLKSPLSSTALRALRRGGSGTRGKRTQSAGKSKPNSGTAKKAAKSTKSKAARTKTRTTATGKTKRGKKSAAARRGKSSRRGGGKTQRK